MSRSVSPVFRVVALGALLLASANADAKPSKKEPKSDNVAPPFDRAAALQSLAGVDLGKCKVAGGPRGEGHVIVAFTPKGEATSATLDQGPFVGTKVQKCIEGRFKAATVPAFAGEPITVGKKFAIQ